MYSHAHPPNTSTHTHKRMSSLADVLCKWMYHVQEHPDLIKEQMSVIMLALTSIKQ